MYKIDKTGSEVEELLDQVEQQSIYPSASEEAAGLMSAEDYRRLTKAVEDVDALEKRIDELPQARDIRVVAASEVEYPDITDVFEY